jgi:phosphoserine phosphatase RsbU/P
MFKFKIKAKLLIILLAFSIVPILLAIIMSLLSTQQFGNSSVDNISLLGETAANDSAEALQNHAQDYLLKTAKHQAAISNALFEKVESTASVIAWHTARTWNNQSSVKPEPSYEWNQKPKNKIARTVIRIAPNTTRKKIKRDINLSSNMDDLFVAVRKNDPNLQSVYLGTESGLHRRAPFVSKRKASYDPRQRGWYKQAVETGKIGWTDLYISASEEILMVTCFKPVHDKKNKLIGVVGLDVTLSSLNKRIISTQIGNNGYALLLDQKGKLIAHPKLSKGNQKWDESFKTENWLENENNQLKMIAGHMTNGETGIKQCRFDGGDKYIAYAPIESTKWSIGVVMPVDEIIKPSEISRSKIITRRDQTEKDIKTQLNKIMQLYALFLVVIIIVITIVAIRLSKAITKPLLSLNEGAQVIGKGKLDHRLKIKTGDELEDLANAFNLMTDDLVVYIKNLQETTAAKEKIEGELNVARDIQLGLLPKVFPPFPEYQEQVDLFAMLKPAKEVGGDLYDYFFIDDDTMCFALGDVSDKGVPAALFMTITLTLIKNSAKLSGGSPAEVMKHVNHALSTDNPRCMFVTLIVGFLNIKTGEIRYVNAGHNLPILIKDGGKARYQKGISGPVAGAMDGMDYTELQVTLEPGDAIFLYTDGVTEAMDAENNLFSDERLELEMNNLGNEHVEKVLPEMMDKIKEHAGSTPQSDDIAMLMLRYK